MRSSNHRASLAVLLGLAAVVAVPAGIVLSRQTAGVQLLDAVWAIPVAALCGLAAILFARGAGGRIRSTLERAGGFGRIRLGRALGVIGICVALSASIAVGFYELLLRLEG
jgi:ABC-type proline/glycine betaine transport system permease subunit